jgi:hypothetical protein
LYQLLQLLLLFDRELQLELHVFDQKVARYGASVVRGVRLRARIARERHEFALVNRLGNQLPGRLRRVDLSSGNVG